MAQPNIKSRAQMSQMKQWRATIETDYWSSVEWAIDLVFTLVGETLEGIQPPHILGLTSHVGLHIFVFSSFSIITIYFANMWCQDICIVQALKQRTAQIDAVLVRCSTHSQIQLNHKIQKIVAHKHHARSHPDPEGFSIYRSIMLFHKESKWLLVHTRCSDLIVKCQTRIQEIPQGTYITLKSKPCG